MNRKTILIAAGLGALLIMVVAFSVIRASTFRLVKSNPKADANTHQYVELSFTFSKALAPSARDVNELTLQPIAAGKVTIADKTIRFMPTGAYTPDTPYIVTIKNVTSRSGESLGDIKLTFNPKYFTYNSLPADVQKRLNIDPTDVDVPYSPDAIAITGTPTLIERGFSEDHLFSLKIALYKYFKSNKQEVRGVDLLNIVKAPHKFGTFTDGFTFDVAAEGKTLAHAALVYSGTNTVQLNLTDPKTNKSIFTSDNTGTIPESD